MSFPIKKAQCEWLASNLSSPLLPLIQYDKQQWLLSVPYSLTETIECLQTNIDHLQSQVEELKSSGRGRRSQGKCDQEKPAPSFACLKELYDLRQ